MHLDEDEGPPEAEGPQLQNLKLLEILVNKGLNHLPERALSVLILCDDVR